LNYVSKCISFAGSVTLSLAEGIMHDVYVSSVVSGGKSNVIVIDFKKYDVFILPTLYDFL
jgi:hypothetical protein